MSDRAIHADGADEQYRNDDPEGIGTEALLPGLAGMFNGSGARARAAAIANVEPTERQAEQQRNSAEGKIGGAPSRVG